MKSIELLLELLNKLVDLFKKEPVQKERHIDTLKTKEGRFHKIRKTKPDDPTQYWLDKEE